jgi:uncharacterized protein YkwD
VGFPLSRRVGQGLPRDRPTHGCPCFALRCGAVTRKKSHLRLPVVKPAALLLVLVAGCATTNNGKWTLAGSYPTAPTLRPFPSQPPAESYGTTVETSKDTDALAARLVNEIEVFTSKSAHVAIVRDARLDRFAFDIALFASEGEVPPSTTVAFLLGYYGMVDTEPDLILTRGGDGPEGSAVDDLRQQLESVANSVSWRRVGIGVRRVSGSWTAVLAFAEHHLDVEPMPRQLHSGQDLSISGRILGPFRNPSVLVTTPAGAVRWLATSVADAAFSSAFACGSVEGEYQVAVNAEDDRGPMVLARFPIYCGITPPRTLPALANTAARSTDPAETEREILDLMNRDRAANGLSPLVRDPKLAEVARRYSQEMAETRQVTHLSRRSGDVVARVRSAGLEPPPRFVAENVGCDYSSADAERGFMASPGHRSNILDPRYTHVGVGVASRKGSAGVLLYITQVFVGWGQ